MAVDQKTVEKIKNFKRFYDQASKVRAKHYLFFHTAAKAEEGDLSCPQSGEQKEPKLAFAMVASKKGVSKSAVKRNRAKRRLKHAFLQILRDRQTDIKTDVQVVFMANKSVLQCQWQELKNHVARSCDVFFDK